ncbi:hypothetical protein BCU68_03370 [Vibrio sp. 10N.286.49.B3]|nr:hypothetical protein BCU68_03370 [Vibrio sp. 10N.286.49.B3]
MEFDVNLKAICRLLEKHHRLIYKGHSSMINNFFKVIYMYDGALNPLVVVSARTHNPDIKVQKIDF